jgi:acetamidase/formamidase
VGEGEDVVMETHDSVDGQIRPSTTEADIGTLDIGAVHPLTGPVFVKGAKPGDALEIEFLHVEPQARGWSGMFPGLGFLREVMTEPFLVHWTIKDGWATSEQIPGVRIPGPSWGFYLHNSSEARSAPSRSALSFSHTNCGCRRPPNPQSVPAMTFSRPTTFA